ncbi:hypothetical protein FPCIR_9406 [Fusarium pseudocircinatum]|uniref:CFEM domain-containing protein n=1 Tax=Fusarium pseudocircinatum TaxID=56676 RepID=A0A8H5P0Y5_9HYPO|nr:hypothetical protein FPCIR_9406 [Fusarium pseudocircinatum]
MGFSKSYVLGAISALFMVVSSTAATSTTTTTTTNVAATALPSLIDSLPECATHCFTSVGDEIGCDATDLKCMCKQNDVFKTHWGICVRKECKDKEFNQSLDIRDDICAAMSMSPDSAAMESASTVIEANSPKETDSGAGRLIPAGAIAAILFAYHSAPTMDITKDLKMLRLDGSKKRIADPEQPSEIGLKTLPTELLIKIATALHPINRASLAFTSSWLHSIIGNALKLNQFDRLEFLRRLELDDMWLSEIFCEICQKFHEPRKSRNFTPREARRACIRYGDPKLEKPNFASHLEQMIEFTLDYVDDEEGPHIRVDQDIYYSHEDRILIKSQRTLFPGRNTGREVMGILNGARNLGWIIHENPELLAVCEHTYWPEVYPYLFRPEDEFKWRRGQCNAYGLTKTIAGFIV